MASRSQSQALTRARSPSPSPSRSQTSSEERAFLEDHSALLVARSYEQACEVCEIQTFHITDSNCIVLGAIDDEFNELPYTNTHFEDSMPILADNDQRLAVVRISRFFADDRDLIYYIQGKDLIPKLMEGVFGRQCFTGPMFGCPVKSIELTSALSEVMSFADNACKVFRMTSHMEGVKWRYFFETGRVLWSRLKIDKHKLRAFRDDYEEEEVQSATSTEARRLEEKNLSENKRGKLKALSAVGSGSLPPLTRETAEEIFAKDSMTARDEAEYDRLRGKIETLVQAGVASVEQGKVEQFIEEVYGCNWTLHKKTRTKLEHRRFVRRLEDVVAAPAILEDGDGPSTGALKNSRCQKQSPVETIKILDGIASDLVQLSRRLRSLKAAEAEESAGSKKPDVHPELDATALTAGQRAALEQFMEVTTQNEGWSRRVLAQCSWDISHALSMHFNHEAVNNAVETHDFEDWPDSPLSGMNDKMLDPSSPEMLELPKDTYFSTSYLNEYRNTATRGSSSSAGYNTAGPSGWRRKPRFDDPEEARKLTAARKRLDALISQNSLGGGRGSEGPTEEDIAAVERQLAKLIDLYARLRRKNAMGPLSNRGLLSKDIDDAKLWLGRVRARDDHRRTRSSIFILVRLADSIDLVEEALSKAADENTLKGHNDNNRAADDYPSDEQTAALFQLLEDLREVQARLSQSDVPQQKLESIRLKSSIVGVANAIQKASAKDADFSSAAARAVLTSGRFMINDAKSKFLSAGDAVKVAKDAELDSAAGKVRESTEPRRPGSTSPLKRPSFQTALDVIGRGAAKKQRGESTQGGQEDQKEQNQVSYIRGGTPAPESANAKDHSSQPRPAVPIFPKPEARNTAEKFDDEDFASKLERLKLAGCKDETLNYETLYAARGDFDKALSLLAPHAASNPPKAMKGHVRFVQDNPQLVSLREMGFLDDEKNEMVLEQCDGDVDRAIDMLFASASDDAKEGAMEVDSGSKRKDKPHDSPTSTEKEDNQPTTSTNESNQPNTPTQQPKTDASAEAKETSALDQFRQEWINEVTTNEAGEKKEDSGFATMEGSRRASDDQGGAQVKHKDKDMMSQVNQRLKAIEESLETAEDEEMADFEVEEDDAEGEEAGAEEVQDEDMGDVANENADVSMSDVDAEGDTDDMADTHDPKADTSMGDVDAKAESEDVSQLDLETKKGEEKASKVEDAKKENDDDGKDAKGEDDKAKPTHNERRRQKKQSKRRRNMAWR